MKLGGGTKFWTRPNILSSFSALELVLWAELSWDLSGECRRLLRSELCRR